jgi:hypothetical protein
MFDQLVGMLTGIARRKYFHFANVSRCQLYKQHIVKCWNDLNGELEGNL